MNGSFTESSFKFIDICSKIITSRLNKLNVVEGFCICTF